MTEKQENILNAALELFAEEGYRSTSTSKVAKKAGVSEGLIFRHFENKQGLLQAIMKMGEEKAAVLFADILMETDPQQVIRKTIDLAENINNKPDDANFWKLQYKIKWELEDYGAHKMEPMQRALTQAFDQLNYEDPEGEALMLLIFMDGMATRYYLQEGFDLGSMVKSLRRMYSV